MASALFTLFGLWNKALLKIGAQRLSSLTDTSNPALQYLQDIWPFETQEFLEEHPWSFAVTTWPMIPLNPPVWITSTSYSVGNYVINGTAIYICLVANTSGVFATDLSSGYWMLQRGVSPILTPLPSMNDGCINPYALPADFINPYLFSAPAFYRKEVIKPPYLPANQTVLLTNNPNLSTMKYVFNQQDLTQWSAKALEAMATKLAWQLCFKISEAAQYAAGLEKDYTMVKLISAITADSNTTTPDESIANAWFIARLSGSTGAVGLGPDNNNVGWEIPGIM
jgi:hypothetical protein